MNFAKPPTARTSSWSGVAPPAALCLPAALAPPAGPAPPAPASPVCETVACMHAIIGTSARSVHPRGVRPLTHSFRLTRGVRSNVHMEAATPLRQAHVRTIGDRLVVDGLVVEDETAVRLVREREEAGGDPVRVVADAVEIGARVLDREQVGANAEFVKGELDKATREVEEAFTERARAVGEALERQLDEAFGAESGHVTKTIQKHFSDDSAGAVQNRVREVVAEALTHVQQSLVQQFSSADARNPLAEFKAGVVREGQDAGRRQHQSLEELGRRMGALQQQLGELRVERDKLAEIEAERERGTAKGRTFEEVVHEAVDRVAALQGDDCDAVGDLKGATGRTGDIV